MMPRRSFEGNKSPRRCFSSQVSWCWIRQVRILLCEKCSWIQICIAVFFLIVSLKWIPYDAQSIEKCNSNPSFVCINTISKIFRSFRCSCIYAHGNLFLNIIEPSKLVGSLQIFPINLAPNYFVRLPNRSEKCNLSKNQRVKIETN